MEPDDAAIAGVASATELAAKNCLLPRSERFRAITLLLWIGWARFYHAATKVDSYFQIHVPIIGCLPPRDFVWHGKNGIVIIRPDKRQDCGNFADGMVMQSEMRSEKQLKIGFILLLLALGLIVTGMRGNTAEKPFIFVQISDTQLGYGGYEHDVSLFRKAVGQINKLKPDFVVFCGDFVENFDQQSITDFIKIRSELSVPSYLTPGNHELYYQPTAATLSRYREIFGKDYFSFTHKGYTFVFTNSQLWKSPLKGETEKLDAWFRETLAAAKEAKSPVFIVQHIPIFLKQPDEPEDPDYNLSPARRKQLLDLMVDSGVIAVLGGHTHQAVINSYKGMQLVNTGALSKNDDKSAVGYRIWRVESPKLIKHEFIPLE